MRALVVEVGPEIEQLVFEICSGAEQHAIQILASKSANQPFHEWMGQGKVGDRLDFRHLQYPQIGLPLVEPIKWIVVGTKVLRHPVGTCLERSDLRGDFRALSYPSTQSRAHHSAAPRGA